MIPNDISNDIIMNIVTIDNPYIHDTSHTTNITIHPHFPSFQPYQSNTNINGVISVIANTETTTIDKYKLSNVACHD